MKNKFLLPGLLAAASGAYLLRRLGRRWGANDDEVHRPMSGDELIPHPMVETTHAITVQANASEVWPWQWSCLQICWGGRVGCPVSVNSNLSISVIPNERVSC